MALLANPPSVMDSVRNASISNASIPDARLVDPGRPPSKLRLNVTEIDNGLLAEISIDGSDAAIVYIESLADLGDMIAARVAAHRITKGAI